MIIQPEVFSDFVLDHQPSSLSDVLELYQDIHKLLGDKNEMYQKAVPVRALLVPITKVGEALGEMSLGFGIFLIHNLCALFCAPKLNF